MSEVRVDDPIWVPACNGVWVYGDWEALSCLAEVRAYSWGYEASVLVRVKDGKLVKAECPVKVTAQTRAEVSDWAEGAIRALRREAQSQEAVGEAQGLSWHGQPGQSPQVAPGPRGAFLLTQLPSGAWTVSYGREHRGPFSESGARGAAEEWNRVEQKRALGPEEVGA